MTDGIHMNQSRLDEMARKKKDEEFPVVVPRIG
jgi:hypothetical protein